MTDEKFKQIKEVQERISDTERKIRNIDLLMSSEDFGCLITGKSKGTFRQPLEYHSHNKQEIIKILKLDRELLSNQLDAFKKLFSEL